MRSNQKFCIRYETRSITLFSWKIGDSNKIFSNISGFTFYVIYEISLPENGKRKARRQVLHFFFFFK